MLRGTPSPLGLALPLVAASLGGCAAEAPARCAFPSAAAPATIAGATLHHYRVDAGPHADELCVELTLPPGTQHLRGPRPMEDFVRDLVVDHGDGFEPAGPGRVGWSLGDCSRGCRARYRLLLGQAASALDDGDLARAFGRHLLSPPSAFLLRSAEAPADAPYRLQVHTAPNERFVTGVFHEDTQEDIVVGRLGDLHGAPYSAFGPLARTRVKLPGGTLDIALLGGEPRMGRAALEAWIEAQARAVAAYFGSFPIAHAAVLALIEPGTEVGSGRTMGNGGASILLHLGRHTEPASLADDWVLVHELCHVAFPNVLRAWAEEGLATYLEPIIRVRAGTLARDELWRGLLEGLPQGQPEEGDRGLDHTDTWGRRYWGGAMFWLLADIEIRKQTRGARSLAHALRAIAREGGNVAVTWSLDRALAVGDAGTGTQVLRDLRARLGASSETVDLAALFRDLGVRLDGDRVAYDEGATLAAVRRAITEIDTP